MMIAAEVYSVRAVNTAHASENKIHDDTVARQLGFSGGLVPGVDVYAYATHAAVAQWGQAWLEHGAMDILLKKPVYEGAIAEVVAEAAGGALAITVRSAGDVCGTAAAQLPVPEPAPSLAEFPLCVPPESRPPAAAEALPPGLVLGSHPYIVTPELAADYLRDIQERDPVYAGLGLVHPGTVLRICNWALAHNVRMGAWIHAGSRVRNVAIARVGDELVGRAKVIATYQRKGHHFVDLDVLVVANGTRPIARVMHTAIFLPRQLVHHPA